MLLMQLSQRRQSRRTEGHAACASSQTKPSRRNGHFSPALFQLGVEYCLWHKVPLKGGVAGHVWRWSTEGVLTPVQFPQGAAFSPHQSTSNVEELTGVKLDTVTVLSLAGRGAKSIGGDVDKRPRCAESAKIACIAATLRTAVDSLARKPPHDERLQPTGGENGVVSVGVACRARWHGCL